MKALIISFTAILLTSASATIINIPMDYRTIQPGIDASSDGDTVLVHAGTHLGGINFNGHNIVLASLFLTTGDTSYIALTVVNRGCPVIHCGEGIDTLAAIIGLTIRGGMESRYGGGILCDFGASPRVLNNIIAYNSAGWIMSQGYGGGIACLNNSNPRIINNYIFYNFADEGMGYPPYPGVGGGIYSENSSPLIKNNVIFKNYANIGGGVALGGQSDIVIANSIFYNNESDYSAAGIAISCSSARILNSIIYANHLQFLDNDNLTGINDYGSNPTIRYCDIQDTLRPGDGNISVDPLFRDTTISDYHLMAIACGDSLDSPCIDAGDPSILDLLLDCARGLGTECSDMGVYGGSGFWIVDIDESFGNLPKGISLSQNYPNPFNISTMINYELRSQSQVTIDIYDILGRKVATLENAVELAGYHQVLWNAEDLSSGVYFYKLQAGNFTETRKMMLIK